jgi:hypothetical protein
MDELKDLLTPTNCALVLIDHQAGLAFAVQSMDRQTPSSMLTVAPRPRRQRNGVGYCARDRHASFPARSPACRKSTTATRL